jgi:hypothetical protein
MHRLEASRVLGLAVYDRAQASRAQALGTLGDHCRLAREVSGEQYRM